MTYKTILACCSHPAKSVAVVNIATDLAEKHDAHLIGLHVVPRIPHASVPRYPKTSDMLTKVRERLQADANEVERVFCDATKSMTGKCEWRCQKATESNLVTHILTNSMGADLVVASQEIDYPLDGVPDQASQLVLRSGRPVIIVPETGGLRTVGERIVVGWKPGREALRAISDALPLLKTAQSVHVVCVNEGGKQDEGLSYLCAALARHGVNTTDISTTGSGAGEALLTQIARLNGDLLVMGCYGRFRVSELIFGGATRHVLKHMAVPVVMSH